MYVPVGVSELENGIFISTNTQKQRINTNERDRAVSQSFPARIKHDEFCTHRKQRRHRQIDRNLPTKFTSVDSDLNTFDYDA